MNLRNALLGATLLALPAMMLPLGAQAQPVTGLYVGAGAGVNWLQSMKFTAPNDGNEDEGTGKSHLGFVGLASVGWGFGNGLRAEIEGNWRSNKIYGGSGNFTSLPSGGRLDTLGVMGNVLFDMDIGANWMYPYVGAGVGYAWRTASNIQICGCDSANGTAGNLAFQAIVGAAFPISQVPGLSVTAEYRFFGVLDTTHADHTDPGEPIKIANGYNHSLLIGARYAFNAAPMPVLAAPAAVAPAAKSYLIFFDWDKSTLTDRARAIIKEAAAASKTVRHTQLEVNGYADTSGNPQYNRGLSMRRAQTAAAELVRNGVAKNEIAIKAFGDTVLLVPTGPGVREPQNRRVEIIIR